MTQIDLGNIKKKIITEMNDGQHKHLIACLLNKLIGKSSSTHSTNRKKIKRWLEASQLRQPCVLLKKDKLQACCAAHVLLSREFYD